MFKAINSLIAIFLITLAVTPAHAALLAINGSYDPETNNPDTPPPDYIPTDSYTGTAVAPGSGTYWNPIIFLSFDAPDTYSVYQSSTNPIPLANSTVCATPVTLTVEADNSNIIYGGSSDYSSTSIPLPATHLTENYMYSVGGAGTAFSFNNVPSSPNGYALYLYSLIDNSASATAFTMTTGGSGTLVADQTQSPYPQTPTTFIEGQNYVEFTGLNPVGGVIAGSFTAAATTGAPFSPLANGAEWNGFQLVELPEPASMSLLGIGGLLLLKRGRKAV